MLTICVDIADANDYAKNYNTKQNPECDWLPPLAGHNVRKHKNKEIVMKIVVVLFPHKLKIDLRRLHV